jgi:hypothetical protein
MDQLQVLGMIPRSTHGITRKEAKEPIKLGKFLHTDPTIHLAATNCPPGRGRSVWKIGSGRPQYKKCFQPKNSAFI